MTLQYPAWTPIATWIGCLLIFSQLQFNDFRHGIIFIGLNIMLLSYYVMFYRTLIPKK